MKEDGMKKLIELFKQHKRETGTSYEYILFRDNDAGLQARCIDDGKEIYIVRQAEILSKKMGFIQRLVENDKIDYEKCIKEYMLKDFGKFYYMSKDEVVIANLSISENPISDLISYLK